MFCYQRSFGVPTEVVTAEQFRALVTAPKTVNLVKKARELYEKGDKKEYDRKKSALYKKKAKLEPLGRIVNRMSELDAAEISYSEGDHCFEEEHNEYESLRRKLKDAGFIREEVAALIERYQDEGKLLKEEYGKVAKDLRIAAELIKEYEEELPRKKEEPTKQREKKHNRKR